MLAAGRTRKVLMGVTPFTFILLPLCVFWIASPANLLKIVFVFAVFEAAAAFTFGSLGVQPGLVPALAFIGFMLVQILLGAKFPGQSQVWHVARPFVVVTAWAVVSSYLMPTVFEGTVFVWPQKSTPPFALTPLAWNPGNFNQDMYLIIDCAFFLLSAMYLRSRLVLSSVIRFYFLSGFLVAAVAFWQFGSKMAGLPYPDSMFYSNPGVAILTEQTMGALPRINGPFTEPAALASYMLSIVCATGWAMLQGHRDSMLRWLFGAGLLTIVLSTSATGFAVLAIVGAGLPVYALASGSVRTMSAILKVSLPFIFIIGSLSATASMFVPDFNKNVQVIYEATVNKQDSSSYDERSSADLDSLAAAVDSYGLGAGWGSNRSSSLVPGLLAQIGLPGCAGLLWFASVLTRQVRKARRLQCPREHLLVMDACCGGLVGFLLPAVLSAPTINSVTFFFLLALLIACATRVVGQSQAGPAYRPSVAGPGHAQASRPHPYPAI